MSGTLEVMKKTEQVRLPADLMRDVRIVAPTGNESAGQFVERAVRELLRREMPKASRFIAKRAAEQGREEAE